MRTHFRLSVLALLLCLSRQAQAHFIWAAVEPDAAGRPVARLWFSEGPYADEARLIEKIAGAQASLRKPGAEAVPLELKSETVDDLGSLVAPVTQQGPYSLEVVCDYGVLTRGEASFLLQYYAKHLHADAAADLPTVARAEGLPLDIVPKLSAEGVEITVLWQGQPAAEAELILLPAKGAEVAVKTDAHGRATFPLGEAGLHAFRAKYVEADRAGERNGLKYDQARHYATLTLNLPAADEAGTVSLPGEAGADAAPSASAMLERARDARAIWENFPGFTANLTLALDDHVAAGTIEVKASGAVTLTGFDGVPIDGVRRQLDSLVAHRLPGGAGGEDVSFADELADHPLGRRLQLNDELDSYYRVRDDVITEVQRKMGAGRFTITVVDVHRNAEGKYLPQLYAVNAWNEDGSLASASTTQNLWTRVGAFDLPGRVVDVQARGDRAHHVVRLDFSDHKLLKAADE